jgi:hypothetical protein
MENDPVHLRWPVVNTFVELWNEVATVAECIKIARDIVKLFPLTVEGVLPGKYAVPDSSVQPLRTVNAVHDSLDIRG